MAEWASLTAAWLLAGVGGAVAEVTTSEPYDCKAGYSTWQADWSSSKKDWCCRAYSLGCKPSSQHLTIEGYDCDLAIGNFEAAWSPEKKEWCCEHEGKGCAADVSLRLCRGIWEDFGWWDFNDDMEVRPTEEQEHKECCIVAGRGGCCHTRKLGDLCFNETSKVFNTPGSEMYSGFQLSLRGSGLHRWEGLFTGGHKKTHEGYWENVTATLIGDVGIAPAERSLLLGGVQKHADWYRACHVDMLTKKHECCDAVSHGSSACCDTEEGHKLCFNEGMQIVNVTEGEDAFNYAITVEDEGCGNYTGRFIGGQYDAQVSILASTFDACSGGQPQKDAEEGEEVSSPHQCLRWHGHGGCDNIIDEQLCLRSRDGRPRREWRDRMVAGQPCAWCGGEQCTSSSDAKCMPADWVRGRPNVTVANCSEGQKNSHKEPEYAFAGTLKRDFEKSYHSSRCSLAPGSEHDSEKPYFTYTAESVDQCKALCAAHAYCAGIGFSQSGESVGVCQIWWHTIESVTAASGHECVKVRGIPGAESMTGIPKLWEHIEHEEGEQCSAPTCSSIPARPAVVPNGCPWGYVGSDFCISTMTRTTTTATKTATTSTSTRTTTTTMTKTITKTITKLATTTTTTITKTITETTTKTATIPTTTTRATTTTRSTTTRTTDSSTTATTTRKTQPATTTTRSASSTATTRTTTDTEAAFLGGSGPLLGGGGPDDDDSGHLRDLLDNASATFPGANASVSTDEGGESIGVEHLAIDTGSEGTAFEEDPVQQEETQPHGLTQGEQAAIGVSAGVAGAALLGGLLGGLLGTSVTTTTPDTFLGGNLGSLTATQPTTITTTWTSSSSPERALLVVTTASESGMPGWLVAAAAVAAVAAALGCIAYAHRGSSKNRGTLLQGEDEEDGSSSSSDDATASPRSKETPLFWPLWACGDTGGARSLLVDSDPASPLNRSGLASPLNRSSLPSSPVRFFSRASVSSPGVRSPGVPLIVPSSPVLGVATPQAPAPLWLGASRPPPGACTLPVAGGASFRPLEPTTASAARTPTEPVAATRVPIEPVSTSAYRGAAFVPR